MSKSDWNSSSPQDDYTAYRNTLSCHCFLYFYLTVFYRHISLWGVLMGLSRSNDTVSWWNLTVLAQKLRHLSLWHLSLSPGISNWTLKVNSTSHLSSLHWYSVNLGKSAFDLPCQTSLCRGAVLLPTCCTARLCLALIPGTHRVLTVDGLLEEEQTTNKLHSHYPLCILVLIGVADSCLLIRKGSRKTHKFSQGSQTAWSHVRQLLLLPWTPRAKQGLERGKKNRKRKKNKRKRKDALPGILARFSWIRNVFCTAPIYKSTALLRHVMEFGD